MLYLLDGGFASHPACQCLFTVSEEVGLDGAKAFDYSNIYAKRLVNIDSPEEMTVVVGCAGGQRTNVIFDIEYVKNDKKAVKISVGGLVGGHSGEDIHRGRQNACKIMGRILLYLSKKHDFTLAAISGGSKENAIARECEAVIVCDGAEKIHSDVALLEAEIKAELTADDSGFFIRTEATNTEKSMSRKDTDRIIGFITAVYVGVIAMNEKLPGIVEFSRNLGIISTEPENVTFTLSSRSAFESRINLSEDEIDMLAKSLGARTVHFNRYPGWTYSGKTSLEEDYSRAFETVYGRLPHVTAIHAGLECGIIKAALSDIEAISVGPDVTDLHSPREALDLASFERFIALIEIFLAQYIFGPTVKTPSALKYS